jgi:hypothetical protein
MTAPTAPVARALDCADAIVDAVRPLGIEVQGRGARRRHRGHGRAHRRPGVRAGRA